MPRPPSPSIPEKEFVYALKQSLRLDGRAMLEMRPPTLHFGPELGWVECTMGKTRVLAQVDGKMVRPPPERPLEGMLTIHSELSPMTANEYEPGRPSDQEATLTRMLDKVLRRSDAGEPWLVGRQVWHIRLTIHVLADAGNMVDCACLAGIVALKHFRRPEVEVEGEEVTVHPPSERAPVPLSMPHTLFAFTFAFYPDPETPPLLDPLRLEETLSEGLLTIALNAQRELCMVQKAGGTPLAPDEVPRVMGVGVARAKELDKIVEARLAEDWKGRNVEVR
ncbi:ribosomal protein S5 domain 2-like protein [Epithele typhae]|uniref:ribosomal protein S5 domain 2-like protein n=1 Tax=Epithele typhae TaxID=378194 RepID=UPI0020074FC6|nr:ribosomal protein S5 domain 2-like protein [Epithele typhae]KAH9910977.1 ribosomal protein S5 domain 2-like protein [Epithele typhae]